MGSPEGWTSVLLGYWRSHGLCDEHARECFGEAYLRYRRKPALPAWGEGKPPPALWGIARDLLCEHWRRRSREQKRVEQLQAQYRRRCEQFCDDELEVQTFQLSLPPRLNEVLTLRLKGHTCQEIAEQLGLSTGTVKSYLAELRQKFVDFYGYDPTKRPSHSGYINGNASEGSTPHEKEGSSDANAHSTDSHSSGSSGGKRVRPAAHSRRARRRAGGVDPASLMQSKGCGCEEMPSQVVSDRPTGEVPNVVPARAGCIEVYEECTAISTGPQYRCIDVFWPCDLFGGWHEKQRRDRSA